MMEIEGLLFQMEGNEPLLESPKSLAMLFIEALLTVLTDKSIDKKVVIVTLKYSI